MSFRPKPWYFERDCPVCKQSASSFCRDPLYFFAHAMRVKWWYHAKFQPFQSSFVELFISGPFSSKQISKCIKIANYVKRVESWWGGFEWRLLNAKKVRSCNKLLIFSSETLILRKRLSCFYTKCLQFLPWPSLLFCTCYAGQMMTPCQVSTFLELICRAFQYQGHLAQNKSVNALKIANYVTKGWKLMTWLWILHAECKKRPEL